jgi:hypothetical protein
MSLLDAKEFDPRPARVRKRMVIATVIFGVAALASWWFLRDWPQKRTVHRFFQALERQDYNAAYAIYDADPDWNQHPDRYSRYPLPQFMVDWGPSSEFGVITSHRIDCAKATGSGVIVAVTVDGLHCLVSSANSGTGEYKTGCSQQTFVWIENRDRALTPSPLPLRCGVLK